MWHLDAAVGKREFPARQPAEVSDIEKRAERRRTGLRELTAPCPAGIGWGLRGQGYMGGDLVSLRVLVIAEPAELELWRQGVGLASVPVEFIGEDPDAAAATLATEDIDICVVDGGLAEPVKIAIVKTAQLSQPAPLVFVTAARGAARVPGVNGMLAKPKTAADAQRLAEICIRTRVPTRVLIVDDSSTMRRIVRKILSASLFALHVQEASEGATALEALKSGTFDLVFLDFNMPGLNGLETLFEIRRESPDVAVVMMTSALDRAIAEQAHEAGVLDFLKKPFYPADIDGVLERYYCVHLAGKASA